MIAYPGAAYPGVYPGQVAVTTFTPPSVRRHADTRIAPFDQMPMDFGQSVLKSPGGSYTTVASPTPEQIDAAAVVYLGGRTYLVDDTEASALTAAGYTVTTS